MKGTLPTPMECIHALDDGRILFGLANGLMEYDNKINSVRNLSKEPDWISDIMVDKQSNIIVSTAHGVKIFDARASEMKILTRDFLTVQRLFPYKYNRRCKRRQLLLDNNVNRRSCSGEPEKWQCQAF